jgi:hypothetical protein
VICGSAFTKVNLKFISTTETCKLQQRRRWNKKKGKERGQKGKKETKCERKKQTMKEGKKTTDMLTNICVWV